MNIGFKDIQLYIPLWYDSNNQSYTMLHSYGSLYIPLWYDSNNDGQYTIAPLIFLYIPLWYDSNEPMALELIAWIGPLYIPLWYDSNLYSLKLSPSVLSFTFHSGTILISSNTKLSKVTGTFTFHSGTILICTASRTLAVRQTLHSTLVRF